MLVYALYCYDCGYYYYADEREKKNRREYVVVLLLYLCEKITRIGVAAMTVMIIMTTIRARILRVVIMLKSAQIYTRRFNPAGGVTEI